jgi:hypothetical protein
MIFIIIALTHYRISTLITLGEPLRRVAPRVGLSAPSPSRPPPHLWCVGRLLWWFRYYPSRFRAFGAGIGALCAPLVSSMLVSST